MEALAMAIIQRDATRHGFAPFLIADQHAGTVYADAYRRDLAFEFGCGGALRLLLGLGDR